MHCDVLVVGAGIGGLLTASELAKDHSVLLLEKAPEAPRNKYWLSNRNSLDCNPELEEFVQTTYPELDFIAYDGTSARLQGDYVVWNTNHLVRGLLDLIRQRGGAVSFGETFLSMSQRRDGIDVETSRRTVGARLLLDCMGHGSPIVAAKRTVEFLGYYMMHGSQVRLTQPVPSVGLHNPLLQRHPTFFELFPTGAERAFAAMIAPVGSVRDKTTLAVDFKTTLALPRYRCDIEDRSQKLFGIIPVGIPRTRALERVAFFGEAAQMNPPTSATGLTTMLVTYREFARALLDCLESSELDGRSLKAATVPPMSPLHRHFQLALFKQLLNFDSDGFRRLVVELGSNPSEIVNGLIFADLPFDQNLGQLASALLRRRSILGSNFWRAIPSLLRAYTQ